MKNRNLCFDQIKGILIILVIVGHVVLGDMQKSPIRALIYFFHMPLFLAITGYFIRPALLKLSIKEIFNKYKHRLIIPFLIAYVFYHGLMIFNNSIITVLKSAFSLYPYYHLWYVPAILVFILYLKFFYFLHQKKMIYLFYILALVLFVITVFFETYLQWNLSKNTIYQWLGDKKFYYFFSYFAFGYLLSIYKDKLKNFVKNAIVILPFSVLLYYFSSVDYIAGFAKVIINFCLIVLTIYACQYQKFTANNFLARVGMVSLPIYLWHIFPLLILQKLSLAPNGYYLCSFLFFSVFILLVIYFEDKNAIINRLFYGKLGLHDEK